MKRTTVITAALILAGALTGCQTVTGKTASQHFNDKWIKHEAKARITAANPRNLTAVSVDVNRGIVYLTGNVPTAQDKVRAEQAARQVDRVRDVVNNLEVETAATAQRAAMASPSASPASGAAGQHTVTGEVASVDRTTGRLTLRSGGDLVPLQVPPEALQNVSAGDRLTVRVALSPAR